ncbi:hypothetical protein ACSBR2_042311 [Camellia fascicularis]
MALLSPVKKNPNITFFDKDLLPARAIHNKPLYVSVKYQEKWVPVVLVDNGSAINVSPVRTASTFQHAIRKTMDAPTPSRTFDRSPKIKYLKGDFA